MPTYDTVIDIFLRNLATAAYLVAVLLLVIFLANEAVDYIRYKKENKNERKDKNNPFVYEKD